MARRIVIGGQPRCGKSTLSREVVHELSGDGFFDGQVLSMDLHRHSLTGIAGKEDLEALSVRPKDSDHSFDE